MISSARPDIHGRPVLAYQRELTKDTRELARSTRITIDDYGRTALHHVAMRGNIELYDYLVELGYDPNSEDTFGESAAGYLRHGLFIDYLLDLPLDREGIKALIFCNPNQSSRNPLASAYLGRWPDLVRALMIRGADPHCMLDSGHTPADIARWVGYNGQPFAH
jgi:ankyrin repeat protein